MPIKDLLKINAFLLFVSFKCYNYRPRKRTPVWVSNCWYSMNIFIGKPASISYFHWYGQYGLFLGHRFHL